jgi:hypothetical protein
LSKDQESEVVGSRKNRHQLDEHQKRLQDLKEKDKGICNENFTFMFSSHFVQLF